MPIYFVILLLEIACIVHIMKTGRERYWVLIVFFLPVAGMIAYAVVEVLPDLMRGQAAHKVNRRALAMLDPDRDLRARRAELEQADTIENRRLLAEEHMARGEYHEAKTLLQTALVGVHAEDRSLMMALAKACLGLGDHAAALAALDRLRAAHPNFQSDEGHLIYARSLEGLGRDQDAKEEYRDLVGYAPGEEVRCRYGQLLLRGGDREGAMVLFREILKNAKLGTARYRRDQQPWIEAAERALAGS